MATTSPVEAEVAARQASAELFLLGLPGFTDQLGYIADKHEQGLDLIDFAAETSYAAYRLSGTLAGPELYAADFVAAWRHWVALRNGEERFAL